MSFDEAFRVMGRDEAFRATVYAMNTLLIGKGVYTAEEFESLFVEHAINFKRHLAEKGNPEGIYRETAGANL